MSLCHEPMESECQLIFKPLWTLKLPHVLYCKKCPTLCPYKGAMGNTVKQKLLFHSGSEVSCLLLLYAISLPIFQCKIFFLFNNYCVPFMIMG